MKHDSFEVGDRVVYKGTYYCEVMEGPWDLGGEDTYYTVRLDSPPDAIPVRLLVPVFQLTMHLPPRLCPECGEEDTFLEEDYVCAPCRFTLWEGQDVAS